MSNYPEHDKLSLFNATKFTPTNLLSEFLDFLQSEMKFEMASYDYDKRMHNHAVPMDQIIAKFVEVDPVKLEKEKEAMLDQIRATNK